MSLLENLKRDKVSDVEINAPVTARPGESIAQVIGRMREQGTGCVLVCDDRDRVQGIFTERDVLTRVLATELDLNGPVSRVMTANPASVHPEDNVRELVRRMHAGGFRHIPVVEKDGSVVGVVSVRRLVEYLVEHFPNAIYTLPPVNRDMVAREGA